MTKNKARHAKHYEFQAGEKILVDTNIWLFLYPPAGDTVSPWATEYSAVFKRLLEAKAAPVTDAIIIGEYLNRYFRIEHKAGWRDQYPEFKDFRKSTHFKYLAEDAFDEVTQILKHASLQDTPLSSFDIQSIFEETKAGTLDFSDALIVENCRLHGWKLLTNDEDCSIGGIEVLTILPRLLKACDQ